MATAIIMPKQGQSVESCILTGILKKKGDTVAVGDVLFTYETDKASFEEESKIAGTVLEIFFEEGDEIPVLMNMMVIGEPGESVEEFRNAGEIARDPFQIEKTLQEITACYDESFMKTDFQSNEEMIRRSAHKTSPCPLQRGIVAYCPPLEGAGGGEHAQYESPVSPRARILAEKHAIRASHLTGTGPGGRVIERDVQSVIDSLPKTTPLAKSILKDDILTSPKTGSGLAGKVRGTDVLNLKDTILNSQFTPESSSELNSQFETPSSDSKTIPLSNIRKRIAKAMQASLQNAAQLTHHLGADARRILDLRKKVKEAVAKGFPTDITLNDMICRATILALQKFPQANAHFLCDSIRYFTNVHLGIAVDTARGLMVPAIQNANIMTIQELAGRLREVANACKKGSINPDLLSSEAASFTISNLGNYGVEMFTPIINLPQVAILGVNTIVPRPKEVEEGVYAFVPYLGLSLTYDHRALDGAEATRFLKQIAIEIENLEIEL